MDALIRYPWPGKVRELENIVERAVVLLLGEFVSEHELPPQVLRYSSMSEGGVGPNVEIGYVGAGLGGLGYVVNTGPEAGQNQTNGLFQPTTLKDMEREMILACLEETGGNKSETAKRLGITRKTLHLKLQKFAEEDMR